MSKKPFCLLAILFFSVTLVQAQADQFAQLRIMQLSYLPPASAVINIQLDEGLIFEHIGFPFATDYAEVLPGEHMLTTTLVDQSDASASIALALAAGHQYSVIVDGDYSQQVTFIVVDETRLRSDVMGSTAVIVNLTDQAIENVTINNEQTLDSVPPNGFGFLALPETEAILGGTIGDTAYSETFTPHANTDFLIAVRLTPTGEPQIIYHRSSRLTVAEYLRSIHEGAQFARVAELLAQTDILDSLADDGEFTLFLPVNAAVDRMLAAGVIPDTAQLGSLFASHATGRNLPPYLLPQHPTLTTLNENTVSLSFGQTDSGYWEIEGAPILWDVRLTNGVIYGIDGVIGASQ